MRKTDLAELVVNFLGKGENCVKAEDIKFYREASNGSLYVKYPVGENECEVSKVDSERFQSWLDVNNEDEGITSKAIRELIEKLKRRSVSDDTVQVREAFIRIGYHVDDSGNESIYLDLNNKAHDVVRVTAGGWDIIKESNAPVIFKHPKIMKELPMPIKVNEADECKKYLREIGGYVNTNEQDMYLVIAWLLIALNADPYVDCPILSINAWKGCGKSTATRFLKSLIDPDMADIISPATNARDFVAAAASRCVMPVDNVSEIAISDTYCRSVTGTTLAIRKLFTDSTSANTKVHARIIINGINLVPERSDLQDRFFPITLKMLNDGSRRSNKELGTSFGKRSPYILGALLYALSAGLKNKDYQPQADDRMLDASLFVLRVANSGVLPFSEDEFREILRNKNEEAEKLNKSKLYDNTLGLILCEMAEEKLKTSPNPDAEIVVWEGKTGDLLKELKDRAEAIEGGIKDIPASPQKLGKALTELSAQLEENGIFIDRSHRKTDKRITRITYRATTAQDVARDDDTSSAESEVSASCERRQTPPVTAPDRPENGVACYDTPTGNTSARRITEVNSTSELADILAGEFGL